MTEHARRPGRTGAARRCLAELDLIEKRMENVGVHPDIAGFQDPPTPST
ncbi:hypothetical protein [Streptomyces sp. KL116D]